MHDTYFTAESRLHYVSKRIAVRIQLLLGRDMIGALATLACRATYFGRIPRDVRDYVLMPYLWEGNRLLGVRHANGYQYGVRHGVKRTREIILYYYEGLRHRIGAPAEINRGLYYYRRGKLSRDRGPGCCNPGTITYYEHDRWQMSAHRSSETIRYETVRFSNGHDFCINFAVAKLFPWSMINGTLYKRGTLEGVRHPAFEQICNVMRDYMDSLHIRNRCMYEYAVAIAEHCVAARYPDYANHRPIRSALAF